MLIENVLYDTETIVHHRFQFDARTDEDLMNVALQAWLGRLSMPFHQVALDKAL